MLFNQLFMYVITDPLKIEDNKDTACTLEIEFGLDSCKECPPRSFKLMVVTHLVRQSRRVVGNLLGSIVTKRGADRAVAFSKLTCQRP